MRPGAPRLAAAVLAGLLLPAAVSVAAPPPPSPETAAQAPSASTSGPSRPAAGLAIELQAPAALKDLLLRHLDLARASRLSADESLDDLELQRLMAAAPAQIRDLLRTEGWFEPVIRLRREPGMPRRVVIDLDPGPRVQVVAREVRIEGEVQRRAESGDAASRRLMASVQTAGPLRPAEPFRNAAWADTKQQWLATLRAGGHAAARLVHSSADIDVSAREARLQGVVDSGPLFIAGMVQVEGLAAQPLRTVEHLTSFVTGQPLTEARLLDVQERLQKSGLFQSISVSHEPVVETAAATPVLVRLREAPLQQATVGLGVSTDGGPRASLEHLHRRPFGWAITAHDKLEWGRDAQRYNGDFVTHPGPDFTRWLVGVQVERLRSDTDDVLSQRLRVGRTQDTPMVERLVFAEWLRSRQTSADGTPSDAQAASANLHLVVRRLDSVLLPTRGFSLTLELGAGQARSTTGDSGPFGRLLGRLTAYVPLGEQWYGKARLEAGQIVKRDAVGVPDALGFRAGGDESVRGYAHRTLTPTVAGIPVSGNTLLAGSAEIARPISAAMPSLWGAVFVDAGRAVQHWRDYKPAWGYGVGVRWRSPVGPVRADLAWGDELRKLRLHLTAGVTF